MTDMGYTIQTVYRINGGILNGTELESVLGVLAVKYPHRASKDAYVPPMKTKDKEVKTWHCCQEGCKNPDFEGEIEALVGHLMIHKGKLLKPWSKKAQLKSPIPAVRLPPNEWDKNPKCATNDDRRFCVQLYIDSVESALRKQGLEVIE